ncbi:MAG: YceH family protein [Actinomycetota bacterium]
MTAVPAEAQLSEVEARVVGCLIEKAFLTPDVYPMTTNALVSACNQKTNREPVMSLDAVAIDGALMELRQRNIVRRVHMQGSRSTKHRHALDDVLELDDEALSIVSVLLLRGPQTVGELRLRTERYVGFDSLDAVEGCLESLAGRSLARQLGRQPGQKEARWEHLLGDGSEPIAAAVSPGASSATSPSPTSVSPAAAPADSTGSPSPPPSPSVGAGGPDQDLVERVATLEGELATLRAQLHRLADQLGESFD